MLEPSKPFIEQRDSLIEHRTGHHEIGETALGGLEKTLVDLLPLPEHFLRPGEHRMGTRAIANHGLEPTRPCGRLWP
ncbi:hypothetical protein [Stutzerimonas chloritidismutans]|uniref:hypothetical protein n=1 Tax=Stutzerimonas chloritidismutans TaxID=203192 RepID=UPI003F5CF878